MVAISSSAMQNEEHFVHTEYREILNGPTFPKKNVYSWTPLSIARLVYNTASSQVAILVKHPAKELGVTLDVNVMLR